MKIGIIIPQIGNVGGGQKVIAKLSYYLKQKGHHVEFFTSSYDKNSIYEEFHKIKINIIKPKNKLLFPFRLLFKKIKGFDVFVFDDFPAYFASMRNKPGMYICYTPKREFYDLKEYFYKNASLNGKIFLFLKNILFKKLDFISARNATIISPISKTVEKRVRDFYKRNDSKIINFGTNVDDYKTGKYEDYFICPSRMVAPKRVDLAIKSMGFVKNKNLKLYVMGQGAEEQNLRGLAKKYPNVEYLGAISEKKLKNLYSNCLGVIYTSLNDDWSLIPIEAGASGKPVIGVNEGGITEIVVDNKTGFLIDDVTPKKIAEKMNILSEDKEKAKEMGMEGKRHVQQFDWSVLLPRIEKIIISMKK